MMQLTLDDYRPGHRPPRARREDPLSSHAAADALERSGRGAAQMTATLRAIAEHPGRTTRELAEITGLDRYMLGRRAADLARAGRIRRTEETPGAELRLWIV